MHLVLRTKAFRSGDAHIYTCNILSAGNEHVQRWSQTLLALETNTFQIHELYTLHLINTVKYHR